MDYLVIGSNGFSQVGRPDFFQKNKVEMSVLLQYMNSFHPIPEEFAHMCFYRAKWFSHDFGNYSEIVLIYDDRILNLWDENDPEIFERFWDWFDEVEGVDLETDSLTEAIKSRYQEYITKSTSTAT